MAEEASGRDVVVSYGSACDKLKHGTRNLRFGTRFGRALGKLQKGRVFVWKNQCWEKQLVEQDDTNVSG